MQSNIVPVGGPVHPDDDPDYVSPLARVLYREGVPFVVWKGIDESVVNYGAPISNHPGWYAAPYSTKQRDILWANGIDAPLLSQAYPFPGPFTPWVHQPRTVAALCEERHIWCLDDPRVGKTPSSVWALNLLHLMGDVKRVLVLAPKTIVRSTWDFTLMQIAPHLKVSVQDKSVPKFKAACLDENNIVVVANHDKIKHGIDAAIASQFDLIIIDEVNKFRHTGSDRASALLRYLHTKRAYMRSWFLTGTPTSGDPDQMYHLAKHVNPQAFKGISFGRWRDMTMNSYLVGDIKKWTQKPGVDGLLRAVLQPCTRAVRSECLDVPPVTQHQVFVPLVPEQVRAIKEMRKNRMTLLSGQSVVAVNPGVLHTKVLQICAGAVYDEHGDAVVIDKAISARADAVMQEWRQTGKKVIFLSAFRHVLMAMASQLEKKSRKKVLILHGNTARRETIEPTFQNDPNYQFLCADPETVQYGMTLSAADTVVWGSTTYKNETWRQANDRPFAPISATKGGIGVVMLHSSELEKSIFNKRLAEDKRQDTELDLIAQLDKFLNQY